MDVALSNEFHVRIEGAREDLVDAEQQLHEMQNDIAAVMEATEELSTEASELGLRRIELEKDEAVLAQSEATAVQNKLLAEKKLMEVGGYECIVRILRKAVQKAKLEIIETEDDTQALIHEELQLQKEIANMKQSLAVTQQNVARLQSECVAAADLTRETEDKLRQLSHFLNQALNLPSSSNDIRPASPI